MATKGKKDPEKPEQLKQWKEDSEGKELSTSTGTKINHTDDSLKAGQRGPTIMEDFHFREKLTHFDHERIPERIVHARGTAAHGYFKMYEDLSEFSKAGIFTDIKKETPVFVRFSTVVGFRGSADTVRDVRGFAVKFYTEEGNWDLVGNNMPVFFIQDAIKFPDLVHSIKPEPHNEMPQASAAHDTFWDFISLMPESMHMIMWVLSDRALPRSYSMMEGFGVHTFRLINKEGKARFVKFHWKPANGVHSLVWDEAQKIAGKNPDYNRKDLWDSIEAGNYPEFELGMQIIEEEDEFAFGIDILDATKLIPEELVPVKIVGKMVLNRNPDNFFAETEQAAFHPGHIVPGIDFTNDPLLQGRLFSYLDTQLIRLGGPNFNEIPINRPVAEVHNNQRDGFHRQTINRGRTSYTPNSIRGGCPFTASKDAGAFVHHMEKLDGQKVRARNPAFKDYFSQAKLFYNSMSEVEKQHILDAFHFELGKVEIMEIRERMVHMVANIDRELAVEIAKGIGVSEKLDEAKIKEAAKDATKPEKAKKSVDRSPVLSQENHPGKSVKGRKVAVLLDEGFDYESFKTVKDQLEKGKAMVDVISKNQGQKTSANGEKVKAEKTYLTTASVLYDAIFVPGGKHMEVLKKQGDVIHFLKEAYKHCKPIGATSEAVELFKSLALPEVQLAGEKTPVESMGVVTCTKKGACNEFAALFEKSLIKHRHWEREKTIDMVPA